MTGIVGCAGLAPTCAAIQEGKDICLANKETLIAGACPLTFTSVSNLDLCRWYDRISGQSCTV